MIVLLSSDALSSAEPFTAVTLATTSFLPATIDKVFVIVAVYKPPAAMLKPVNFLVSVFPLYLILTSASVMVVVPRLRISIVGKTLAPAKNPTTPPTYVTLAFLVVEV